MHAVCCGSTWRPWPSPYLHSAHFSRVAPHPSGLTELWLFIEHSWITFCSLRIRKGTHIHTHIDTQWLNPIVTLDHYHSHTENEASGKSSSCLHFNIPHGSQFTLASPTCTIERRQTYQTELKSVSQSIHPSIHPSIFIFEKH